MQNASASVVIVCCVYVCLLVCGVGIWDVLSNQEAIDFVRARIAAKQMPVDVRFIACRCQYILYITERVHIS